MTNNVRYTSTSVGDTTLALHNEYKARKIELVTIITIVSVVGFTNLLWKRGGKKRGWDMFKSFWDVLTSPEDGSKGTLCAHVIINECNKQWRFLIVGK